MKHYTIKYGDTSFEASEYQDIIFDNVENGKGNMVISAAAGASKTTTIINCIDIINPKYRLMFIAFNKDIVENIRNRIGNRDNVKVTTFHSLGWMVLVENGVVKNQEQTNEFKYKNYIKNNIDQITIFKETRSLKKNYTTYINNIIDLSEYCRYYTAFSLKDIRRIADKYGIVPVRDEIEVTKKVLTWGKNNTKEIDFTDMVWLPSVLNLNTKKYLFDWVLIDEAQDTSIAEQKLVDKCFKRGARFIAVGDECQQINVWAGASEEAMDNFKKYAFTNLYKLPISYRCPKKIVELAKKYSDNIIAKEDAIEGAINYNVKETAPTLGDMVLCRTTAPLIELHLKYMRLNVKSYVRGFENIKSEYIRMINFTDSKIIDRKCVTSNGLFPQMYERLLNEIEKVKKIYNLDDDDAYSHPSILSMYDSIEGLKVLSEGLTEVEKLKEKINIVFGGDDQDAIQLSTVHKAKGLEADNVYILHPSLMPSRMAKKEWEIKTENNLIYVAYTRAKKSLNFMEEPDYGRGINYGIFNITKMKDTLEEVKRKIKYNKENGFTEKYIAKKPIVSNVSELGKPKPIVQSKNKNKAGLKLRKLMQ